MVTLPEEANSCRSLDQTDNTRNGAIAVIGQAHIMPDHSLLQSSLHRKLPASPSKPEKAVGSRTENCIWTAICVVTIPSVLFLDQESFSEVGQVLVRNLPVLTWYRNLRCRSVSAARGPVETYTTPISQTWTTTAANADARLYAVRVRAP